MSGAAAGAAAMQIVGGTIQAQGAKAQAKAQSEALKRQAEFEARQTKWALEDVEREKISILGTQRAAFGAHGVKVSVGSPMSLEAEADRRATIEKKRISEVGTAQVSELYRQASLVKTLGNYEAASLIAGGAGRAAGTPGLGGGGAKPSGGEKTTGGGSSTGGGGTSGGGGK